MVKQPSVVGIHKIQQIKNLLWTRRSHFVVGSFPEPRLVGVVVVVDALAKESLGFSCFCYDYFVNLNWTHCTVRYGTTLYAIYITIYVPTCGNNLWPNAVAGAQKFFFFLLLINTMNDLLSMSRSLSLSGN